MIMRWIEYFLVLTGDTADDDLMDNAARCPRSHTHVIRVGGGYAGAVWTTATWALGCNWGTEASGSTRRHADTKQRLSDCAYVLVSPASLYKAAAGIWDPSPATSRCRSLVSRMSVTTCGQRKQAAGPSWRNQRQVGRMAQRGKERTTGSSIVAMRVARLQLVPSKWPQPWPMQGAAMRMTSVGAAGDDAARISGETGCDSFR